VLGLTTTIARMHLDQIRLDYVAILGGDYESVKANGYCPRDGLPPVPLSLPFAWKHRDRNAANQLHAWRFLHPIFQKYLATKHPAYIAEAITYMRDWDRFRTKSGDYSPVWGDVPTGMRCIALAFVLSLDKAGHIELSNDDKNFVLFLSGLHTENLSSSQNITVGNHAVHQLRGLRMLSMALADDGLDAFCNEAMSKLLEANFDKYHVNTENSPFYHHYNVQLLRPIGKLFPSLNRQIRNIVQNGRAISAWLTDHNGDFYSIGDSEGHGVPFKATVPIDPISLPGKFVHKDLHQSGYIVIRSHATIPAADAEALVFHATNATHVHSHADHLSFILVHKGVELFADPGKHSYQYDEWRQYFRSDIGHNTVGLAGIAFNTEDTPIGTAKLEPVVIRNSQYFICGSVPRSDCFKMSRSMAYAPGQLLTITDQVEHNTQNAVEARFHLGIGVEARPENGKFLLLKDDTVLAELHFDPHNLLDAAITDGWVSKRSYTKIKTQTLLLSYAPHTTFINTRVRLL